MNYIYTHLRGWAMLCLLFMVALQANAQSKISVTGQLTDSTDGKAVAWATVGLYRAGDMKTPLQNVFSGNKGKFEFTRVDTGSYVLVVTYTGYAEEQVPVKVEAGQQQVEIAPILLKPQAQQLGGVVVSSRKPLIEQDEDKMVFNAEADPSLSGLTAVDVLRKTPFLSVDADGNVQLNGQSNFKVLLNGKETAMFARNLKDALRSMPASLIRRVEVSTSPSAKYDGEGIGGIINIITQKKVAGYNGNIGISYNSLNSLGLTTNFNVKYGKMGLSGYYGIFDGRPPQSQSYSEIESLHPVAFYKRTAHGWSQSRYGNNFGNIELAWDIDTLNTFSVYAGQNSGTSRSRGQTDYEIILPGNGGVENSLISNSIRTSYPGYNVGTDYVRKFRKNQAAELAVKAFYDISEDASYSYSEQFNKWNNRFTLNDNNAPNRQATLQADVTYPLKKGRKLEAGVKTILRRASSDYESLVKYNEEDAYAPDASNSNSFRYHQNVYSAFATYSFKWKNVNFRLGGRFEQTEVEGEFIRTNTRVQQSYGTFLPNIYLSRKINKIHTLSLSYGKRLRRPYIWDLNPFVFNIDSFNISYGNPNLGPDIIHNVESGYSVLKGNTSLSIRLSQSFSNRQIVRYTIFDEATGVAANVVANAGIVKVTGLNASISTRFTKKWSLTSSISLRYSFLKNRYRPEQKNNGMGGYFTASSNYTVNDKWTIFLSGSYYRSEPQLQGQYQGYFYYNTGVSYKMFNKKLTLSLQTSRPFNKYLTWRSHFQDENFIRSSISRNVQRNLSVSVRWNFGKLKENVSRKRGVSNDDIRK